MPLPRFKSLGETLGAFGRSIISRAQEIGRGFAETLGLLREAEIEPAPLEMAEEWGETWEGTGRKDDFLTLRGGDHVPEDWYEFSEIPWARPFCYTVEIFATDLETGELVTQELHMTGSRPLSVNEIFDITAARIGETGASPKWEIEEFNLVGAFRRSGEAWRW